MAFLSHLRDINLEKQLTMLSNEIASLKELAARRGNNRYGDAGDGYYADLTNAITSVLPSLRKRSSMVGAATFNRPAAVAVVGLLVVGLVASVFLTRRPPKEPNKIEPGRKRTPSRAASSGASKKRTANTRTAPAGGRKRLDGPIKYAPEPKAGHSPDSGE